MNLRTTPRHCRPGAFLLLAACVGGAPLAPGTSGAAERSWLELGPAAIAGGQLENVAPATVAGAIHALAPHPLDPDVLYVGSVNGGVWKATNATAWSPGFVPLTDQLPSLSISELEFDPTDPSWQTLVAGTGRQSALAREGGPEIGLYRTTDGGVSWAALGPAGAGTCTGVVARGDSIVAGFSAAGVVRSRDAGATWEVVSGAGSGLPAGRIMDLVADPGAAGVLYAVLARPPEAVGIFRSADGGAAWTKVSDAAIDARIGLVTFNVEMAVGRSGEVWAGIVNAGQVSGIFRSGDAGASWSQLDLPLFPAGEPRPVSGVVDGSPIVVVAPGHGLADGDRVRLEGVTGTTAANGLWRVGMATDGAFELRQVEFPFAPVAGNGAWTGGGAWQQVVDINPRFRNQASPAAQGQIHFAIQADPVDPHIVYLGGDRQDDPFPNFLGARVFTGALVRGDATVAATGGVPSPQWEHLTHSDAVAAIPGGGTASSSAPHADARDLEFDAAGDLLLGDDGGLFRRTSPRDNRGDWFGMSGNLAITEMHSVAWDSLARVAIGGTQDNGTVMQPPVLAPVWDFFSGGDGGQVAVERDGPVSIRYSSAQQLLAPQRSEFDATGIELASADLGLVLDGPGEPVVTGAAAPFFVPLAVNAVAPLRLAIASQNLYESFDRGDTVRQILAGATFGASLLYGGRRDGVDFPDLVWAVQRRAGDPNRFVVRRRESLAAGFVETAAAYPGVHGVEAMAVDPDDWGRLATVEAAADGTPHVWLTEDGGESWRAITGNLGALTRDPRALAFVPGTPGHFVVGALGGAFATALDGAGVWFELAAGLPTVLACDLLWDATDDVLLAATLGRGAWALFGASQAAPAGALVGHAARAPRRDAAGAVLAHAKLAAPWVVALADAVFPDVEEAWIVERAEAALLPASVAEVAAPAAGGQVAYSLRAARQSLADPARRPERFVRRERVVANALGDLGLQVRQPARLLLPAVIEPGAAGSPRGTAHLCYDVAATRDDRAQTPGGIFRRDAETFVADAVLGADCGSDGEGGQRFAGTAVAGHCLVRLLRPHQLCNPVVLRPVGAGFATAAAGVGTVLPRGAESLLCYRGRLAGEFRSAAAAAVVGAERLDRVWPPQGPIRPRRTLAGSGFRVEPHGGFPAPRHLDTEAPFDVCLPTTVRTR